MICYCDQKLIDDICEHLYSKMTVKEWISLNELAEIMRGLGLSQNESEVVLSFLKKYFLEVDESEQRARLNSWISTLLEKVPSR